MHRGDGPAVAGDADEADQALLARLARGIQRAARRQRLLPLVRMAQRVELQEVDPIGAQALERALDLGLGGRVVALAGLGREEEIVAVAIHPGPDAELGLAVGGCGVDVVDAELEQQVEHAVGGRLVDPAERRGAEDHAGAHMSGAPEGPSLDRHGGSPLLRPPFLPIATIEGRGLPSQSACLSAEAASDRPRHHRRPLILRYARPCVERSAHQEASFAAETAPAAPVRPTRSAGSVVAVPPRAWRGAPSTAGAGRKPGKAQK